MAKDSPHRRDGEQHEQRSEPAGSTDDRTDGGSGGDRESPGRSLLDDDAEIVEPNEPA